MEKMNSTRGNRNIFTFFLFYQQNCWGVHLIFAPHKVGILCGSVENIIPPSLLFLYKSGIIPDKALSCSKKKTLLCKFVLCVEKPLFKHHCKFAVKGKRGREETQKEFEKP